CSREPVSSPRRRTTRRGTPVTQSYLDDVPLARLVSSGASRRDLGDPALWAASARRSH
ncbi:MAG: hypothetical protein AVDCRST_MAG38-1985, partial [uncultured Solirubrobacteraceae bacterium]